MGWKDHVKCSDASFGRQIGINKKRLISIRRGEGGGRGVVWAFMPARVLFLLLKSCGNTITPRPYGSPGPIPGFPASVDA